MSNAPRRHTCVVAPGEFRFEVPDGIPLLQAARNAGIDLPASCRNGTCRACLCRLVDGKIGYRIAWPGLSAEEKRDGYILPCVALPESDVVLEVPRARLLATG